MDEKRKEKRGRKRRGYGHCFVEYSNRTNLSIIKKTSIRKRAYIVIPCSKIDDDKLHVYFPSKFVCLWR